MFTGLIQQLGKLTARETNGGFLQLVIGAQKWDSPLAAGESISVNGVCLTAAKITDNGFTCDVLKETVACSNLGSKQTGATLNLERAILAGEPLGGHLISGHVEGLGTLVRRVADGKDWRLDFKCGVSLLCQMVNKGSIACDGISLTISSLSDASFSVNIIPYTWQNTNLHQLHEGETVNLETDLIGKYVNRRMEQNQRSDVRGQWSGGQGDREPEKKSITEDILRQAGFME